MEAPEQGTGPASTGVTGKESTSAIASGDARRSSKHQKSGGKK